MFTEKLTPLRVCRIFQRKSIHVVGNETGIDPAKLSLFERNLKKPTPKEKRLLAKALRARIRDLFPPSQEASNG